MNRQGLHDGSARFAWAVISISVYSGFLRTSNQRRGIADHASICSKQLVITIKVMLL